MALQYQNSVQDTKGSEILANQDWRAGEYIEFVISPLAKANKGYFLNNLKLNIPMTFTELDGTPHRNTEVPVNMFPVQLIKKIVIINGAGDIILDDTTRPTIRNLEKYYANLTTAASAIGNAKDSRDRLKFFYSDSTVGQVNRRDNDGVAAATRTNANIDARIAAFAQYKADGAFKFLLKFLHSFFTTPEVISDQLIIRLYLNNEMTTLFETTARNGANNAHTLSLIKYKITETPYLDIQWVTLTDTYVETRDKILRSRMTYRLNTFPMYVTKQQEMGEGAVQTTMPYNNQFKNFDKFIIKLTTNNSHFHTSHYDNYGVELASKSILSITFNNFYVDGVIRDLKFNLDDRKDRKELYKNYLAEYLGKNSSIPEEEYVSIPQLHDIPKISSYFLAAGENEHTTLGSELVVDVSPSKNLMSVPDRSITSSSNLTIEVRLRSAVPQNAEIRRLQIVGVYEGGMFYYNGNVPPNNSDNQYSYTTGSDPRVKTIVLGSRK